MTKPRAISNYEKYGGRFANSITDSSMNRIEIIRAKKLLGTRSGIRNITAEGGTFMADGKIGRFSTPHKPFTLSKSHLTPSAYSITQSREQSVLTPSERHLPDFKKPSAAHPPTQNDKNLTPTILARGLTTPKTIPPESPKIQPTKSANPNPLPKPKIGKSKTTFPPKTPPKKPSQFSPKLNSDSKRLQKPRKSFTIQQDLTPQPTL
jgi:hypothetical protein